MAGPSPNEGANLGVFDLSHVDLLKWGCAYLGVFGGGALFTAFFEEETIRRRKPKRKRRLKNQSPQRRSVHSKTRVAKTLFLANPGFV